MLLGAFLVLSMSAFSGHFVPHNLISVHVSPVPLPKPCSFAKVPDGPQISTLNLLKPNDIIYIYNIYIYIYVVPQR